VKALGGLYVIGTNRHESGRVDLQLRGRAGRQGDPGESRFFVSLEDDLLARYGIRRLIGTRAQGSGLGPRENGPQGSGLRPQEAIENPVIRREVARAQRIIEGQDLEIRRTLHRYSFVVERQRREVMQRRQALLSGAEPPNIWSQAGDRYDALVAAVGQDAVDRAEVAVTLHHIDRLWRDHLALCADLREGIHLVSLAGKDPLTHFTHQAIGAFRQIEEAVDDAVLESLALVRATGGSLDLGAVGLKRPSSTWTYIVNDDPFRNQLGRLLTGMGGKTIAIYTAGVLWPLLLAWAVIERIRRKRLRTPGSGLRS
jgi:preprotein translocase subunit SecA